MKKIKLIASAVLASSLILAGCENLDTYEDTIAPSVVSNVTVKSLDTGDAVEFTWSDPADKDFDHIEVEYKLDGETKKETVEAGTEYLEVNGLNHEMGYQFVFYSVDKNGNRRGKDVGAFATKYNGGYMVSYFKSAGNGNADYENLFLGKSIDGLNYTGLLNNTYYYKIDSSEGSGNTCVRDPYMNRLHDNDETDSISWFIELATDWTNFNGTSHPEYGTTRFTNYWGSEGYSPSILVSIVKVDTENQTVDFLRPVSGSDPYGASVNGSVCKRMIAIPDDAIAARGRPMHAWAPEILIDYDEETGGPKPIANIDGVDYFYGVIWSGNGDAVIQNADGSYQEIVTSKAPYSGEKTVAAADYDASAYTEGWICRTFINYTNDFYNYTRPYFYFENTDVGDFDKNGNNTEASSEIDATMVKVDDMYYMPYKGEASGATDINFAKSISLNADSFVIMHNGQWVSRTNDQATNHGIEGPWMILDTTGRWWLIGDQYSRGQPGGTNNFVACVSSNITAAPKDWRYHDNDGTYSMPTGIRHAFAFRVTEAEMAAFEAVTAGIVYN